LRKKKLEVTPSLVWLQPRAILRRTLKVRAPSLPVKL
jgi:hypothetical protein